MALKVIYGKCTGCSLCVKACPFAALELVDRDTISLAKSVEGEKKLSRKVLSLIHI